MGGVWRKTWLGSGRQILDERMFLRDEPREHTGRDIAVFVGRGANE